MKMEFLTCSKCNFKYCTRLIEGVCPQCFVNNEKNFWSPQWQTEVDKFTAQWQENFGRVQKKGKLIYEN